MKKHFLSLLMLFTMVSMTVAQPAMMTKGYEEVDTLCQNRLSVEIVDISGVHFSHPQHPENGIMCPTEFMLTTSSQYELYQWETSLPSSETWNEDIITVRLYYSGYIKVTVRNFNGSVASDSIWFNVRNKNLPPMEGLIMEIDDDLHANFHGIAAEEHHRLFLHRGFFPGQSTYYKEFYLSPGEWVYKDLTTSFSEDSLWYYDIDIYDVCNSGIGYRFPGLLLGTTEDEYENRFLTLKSILQHENAPLFFGSYVYLVYTVDRNGTKHPVTDENGDPVVLQPIWFEPASWPISPDMIAHPFYQCGVAKELEDGSHQLFSLSNKVVNPFYPFYPYHYEALRIEEVEEGHTYEYCLSDYGNQPFIALLGENDCEQQTWEWHSNGEHFGHAGDSIAIDIPNETRSWDVVYHGCDKDVSFRVLFYAPVWDNPFETPFAWKHNGEAIGLTAIGDEAYASGDIACLWSTGETTNHIEVAEAGTYSVGIEAHGCSDTYAVVVRDNVEIALATVDLKTGRDKVTWRVDPEQADYIDKVKVIRYDGSAYRAPYAQGHYLFSSIEDVARNYHIVAVSKEGQDCPVASYERGTIHASYEQDADGYLNIQWNAPYLEPGIGDVVAGFEICLYDAASETVTVVDEVAASATDYTDDASQYAGDGEVVVAAVFGDGSRSYSNRYTMVGVEEYAEGGLIVYPNPASGRFTVEGLGNLSITNVLGQTVLVREIDGKENVELPRGLYFVKLNGQTRKIVVE